MSSFIGGTGGGIANPLTADLDGGGFSIDNIDQLTITQNGSTPFIGLIDSNTTDGDIGVAFSSNATDAGSGTEDVDFILQQQIGGSLTTIMNADADGDINFGRDVDIDGQVTMDGLFTIEESGQVRGYFGVDSQVFTGALANSVGYRAENAMHIGAGGNNISITLGGISGTPAEDGQWFQTRGGTWTDTATAAAGTATYMTFNSFEEPTLAATNANVSTTIACNLQIPGMPQEGTNQTITNAVALIIGSLGGYTTDADSGFGAIFFPPGIADGVGAVTTIGGFNVQSPSGGVSLGDQTATLDEFFCGNYDQITLTSDTLTRTVTDAATMRVRGAPQAGANVTFTNTPYALYVVEEYSRFGGRVLTSKGSDVASADEITLGDGNYFVITGTTDISHIDKTGWTNGSIVILRFSGTLNVTHNAGALSGTETNILLASAGDFSATSGDTLTLIKEDDNTFREIARAVI